MKNLKVTGKDSEWSPKYFGIIVGLFCGLYVISNALNTKIIDFWGVILPAGILTFPLCCIITDLLTEVYGFNRTRQAIWTVLCVTILYAVFMTLALHLPPAGFWQNQAAYEALFTTSFRIAAAGCAAWLVGEFINSYVMSKLKIFQKAKHMGLRFIGSTAIAQFFDTFIYATIAFAGTMPWPVFFTMCLWAWAAKVAYETIALPVSLPVTQWVKRLEGVEHYDKQKISVI